MQLGWRERYPKEEFPKHIWGWSFERWNTELQMKIFFPLVFFSGSCCRCCSGHILCPLKAVTKSPLMAVALDVGCVRGITLSMVMNNCFCVILVFDKPYICENPSFYRLNFSWLFSSLRHNFCTCQNQWIQLYPTSNQFWRFLGSCLRMHTDKSWLEICILSWDRALLVWEVEK